MSFYLLGLVNLIKETLKIMGLYNIKSYPKPLYTLVK